jgi:hypothetical protein
MTMIVELVTVPRCGLHIVNVNKAFHGTAIVSHESKQFDYHLFLGRT